VSWGKKNNRTKQENQGGVHEKKKKQRFQRTYKKLLGLNQGKEPIRCEGGRTPHRKIQQDLSFSKNTKM